MVLIDLLPMKMVFLKLGDLLPALKVLNLSENPLFGAKGAGALEGGGQHLDARAVGARLSDHHRPRSLGESF